uniref:Uncharacterized protein n=3 Tax=Oryza TaxID=4527 RepID=A0A0D3G4S4_9ORYZ
MAEEEDDEARPTVKKVQRNDAPAGWEGQPEEKDEGGVVVVGVHGAPDGLERNGGEAEEEEAAARPTEVAPCRGPALLGSMGNGD